MYIYIYTYIYVYKGKTQFKWGQAALTKFSFTAGLSGLLLGN